MLANSMVCRAQMSSMVVRRHRVYGSHLWRATENVEVVCSRLCRQEQDGGTHVQPVIYTVQYSAYSRPHRSSSSDADKHNHTCTSSALQVYHITTGVPHHQHTCASSQQVTSSLQVYIISTGTRYDIKQTSISDCLCGFLIMTFTLQDAAPTVNVLCMYMSQKPTHDRQTDRQTDTLQHTRAPPSGQQVMQTFLEWCSNGIAQLQLLACRRLFHSMATDWSSQSSWSTATTASTAADLPFSKPESALVTAQNESSSVPSGWSNARKSNESDALRVCSAFDNESSLQL